MSYESAPVISTKKRNPAHSVTRQAYDNHYRLYRLNRARIYGLPQGNLSKRTLDLLRVKLSDLSIRAWGAAGLSWVTSPFWSVVPEVK
jgi:hypothetical protein